MFGAISRTIVHWYYLVSIISHQPNTWSCIPSFSPYLNSWIKIDDIRNDPKTNLECFRIERISANVYSLPSFINEADEIQTLYVGKTGRSSTRYPSVITFEPRFIVHLSMLFGVLKLPHSWSSYQKFLTFRMTRTQQMKTVHKTILICYIQLYISMTVIVNHDHQDYAFLDMSQHD